MAKMTMDELLNGAESQALEAGISVEGKILSVKKNEVLVDMGSKGIGMVPKREIGYGKNTKLAKKSLLV